MNIEFNHTKEELDNLGRSDDLWDFDYQDLFDGAVEPREDVDYWFVEGRLYEVEKNTQGKNVMTIFYYAGQAGYGILAYHRTEEFRFYMHAEDVIGSDVCGESDFDIRMASNTSVLNLKKALEDKGYKNIGDGLWER